MSDSTEKIIELKKYFKKIQSTIDRETVFTLFNNKIVNKNPIDDILCCIEASFPDSYKKYVRQQNKTEKKIETPQLYAILKSKIQNKFAFSNSHYSIKFKDIPGIIISIINAIDIDMRVIEEQL